MLTYTQQFKLNYRVQRENVRFTISEDWQNEFSIKQEVFYSKILAPHGNYLHKTKFFANHLEYKKDEEYILKTYFMEGGINRYFIEIVGMRKDVIEYLRSLLIVNPWTDDYFWNNKRKKEYAVEIMCTEWEEK